MNLPVRVPSGEEAAAFGGAIQALWTLEKTLNKAASIETIAGEHVVVEGSAILPDAKSVSDYESAYSEYLKYLDTLKVLYR
jgi:xylulokinase